MPSKPNAKTKPPRLVLFDTIPELTIVTGSISEMINSPTKVKPQNSPNSPISGTFGTFSSGITNSNSNSNSNSNNNSGNTAKYSPTLPSPTTSTSRDTPSASSPPKSSPTAPATPPMLPPPGPYPWLWSCHSCRSVYRLACTRRCLECGHIFCCLMPAVNEGGSQERDKNGKKRKRSGSGRKGGGPCTAEFDYLGWSAWGSYRRSVTGAASRRAFKVAGGGDDDLGGKRRLESSGSGKRRLASVSVSISPFPSPPSSSSSSSSSSSTSEDTTTPTTSIDFSSDWEKSAEEKAAAARLQDFATWHLIPVPTIDSSPSSSQSSTSSPSPGKRAGVTLAWHHVSERETRTIARAKEKMYVERIHNCWSHCDYPSECRQTVIAACEEGRAKIDRKGKKLVWVDDREKDAIEARRRKERERERENMKRALGARRSRAGQEERERRMGGQRGAGRKGRGHGHGHGHGGSGSGSGSGNGSANGAKKKWEWGLEPVAEYVEEEEKEDVEMKDVQTDKDGGSSSSSSSSSSTSSAGGSSSSSSSDSSSSEDEGLLVNKSEWKDTMPATTMSQGMQEGPEDDNTSNLTIAMLEPFSRVDGCSSRQDCYITVVADDKTIDPAKLLKSNDPETIPASPVSPLAEGCLTLGNANMSSYESFTSLIDFGPMEIDEMAM